MGKTYSRKHFEIFFLFFFQKTGFDISCKLSPVETICMKCQILFSRKIKKKKKNVINLSPAEFAQIEVKVKKLVLLPLCVVIQLL